MTKQLLNRIEFGEAVFHAIKSDLESRGFALWQPKFDPDYPIKLRQIHNIRKGNFEIKTLQKLQCIQVEEWFCISNCGITPSLPPVPAIIRHCR